MRKIASTSIFFLFLNFVTLNAQGGGTCAYFDGGDDYLTPGNKFKNYSGYYSFWAYRTSWIPETDETFFSTTNSGGYSFRVSDGGWLEFRLWNGLTYNNYYAYIGDLSGGWHHFGVNFLASESSYRNVELFVDGERVHSSTPPSYVLEFDSDNYFMIGVEAGSGSSPETIDLDFEGWMDEFMIRSWLGNFNTYELVQSLMHVTLDSINYPYDNLEAYYRFESDWPAEFGSWLDDMSDNLTDNGRDNDLTNHDVFNSSMQTPPVGKFPTVCRNDAQALWNAMGSNYSRASNTLSMKAVIPDSITYSDFIAFAHNDSSGITDAGMDTGFRRSKCVWYIDSAFDDEVSFKVNVQTAGLPDFLAVGNYFFIKMDSLGQNVSIIDTADAFSNDYAYFNNAGYFSDPDSSDGYYGIAYKAQDPEFYVYSVNSYDWESAEINVHFTNNGGLPILSKGLCCGTETGPDLSDLYTNAGSGDGAGFWTIPGLSGSTLYYVKCYCTTELGTYYFGTERTFTTLDRSPMFESSSVSASQVSAEGSASIESGGASAITERGFCWSTESAPTIDGSKVVSAQDTNVFTATMSPLVQHSFYYARAYAVNSDGIGYGDLLSFSTTPDADEPPQLNSVYQISTLAHLRWIAEDGARDDLDFALIADIDMSETENWFPESGGSCLGWEPIALFTGTFDGNGHDLSNLYIDRDSDYNGLFGRISTAAVSDLKLTGAEVRGYRYTGILAGYIYNSSHIDSCECGDITLISGSINSGGICGSCASSEISHCSVQGQITGSSNTGGISGEANSGSDISYCSFNGQISASSNYIGGLIGYFVGGGVSCCSAVGSCSGNSYTGGLIGYLNGTGQVSRSLAGMAVNAGSTGYYAGGFVGYLNDGTVNDCYSRGSVSGYSAGGFAGYTADEIHRCYSTGNVTNTGSSSYIGAFIGRNSTYSSTTHSFWDSDSCPLGNDVGSAWNYPTQYAVGKSAAEMRNEATFTTLVETTFDAVWDFSGNPNDDAGDLDIWQMDDGGNINDGYPVLSWQADGDQSLPVSLMHFEAVPKHLAILLKWTTASETDNLGFILCRKVNDSDGTQEVIASYAENPELAGAGNSTEKTVYSFLDEKTEPGVTYVYTLSDVDYSGRETRHPSLEATCEAENTVIAESYTLRSVYPNPFNAAFTLPFSLNETVHVTAELYNVTGQRVTVILDRELSAGNYDYRVNADDLGSGVYLLKTVFKDHVHTQKLVLLK